MRTGFAPPHLHEARGNIKILVGNAAELQHLCGSQRPSEADLWVAATAYMLDCRLATEDERLVHRVRDKVEVITTHGE